MKRKNLAIMVCGTASHVGKSVLVTALCRIFRQDGLRVAPFKSQNMALNSYVTKSGGEIGRAQAVQAEAAGIEPAVDMNPILLKPTTDRSAQVVIMGRVYKNMSAVEYHEYKKEALKTVRSTYRRLASEYDCIVLEGAGSPAEINLKRHDIVNLKMARIARAPVILTSDIDRGGVFASLFGTIKLLPPRDRRLIKALHINKFRGDLTILQPGLLQLKKLCAKKIIGVSPYIHDLGIEEEDSVRLEERRDTKLTPNAKCQLSIDILTLPHISNYTDFDPLEREPGVRLRYVRNADSPSSCDVLILPGTKNTIGDLAYLRSKGWDKMIRSHYQRGGMVLGICGGFQMMGKTIRDPNRVESNISSREGLGLLDIETTFSTEKTTTRVEARAIGIPFSEGTRITGYEIHMGNSVLGEKSPAAFEITSRNNQSESVADGAVDTEGRAWGTYIHGIFENDEFRQNFITHLRAHKGVSFNAETVSSNTAIKEQAFDRLAKIIRESLDMKELYRIMRKGLD